jgi:hypothetical protein
MNSGTRRRLNTERAPNQSRTGGATMAARELIHFLFWPQLDSRPLFPTRFPSEPVGESPP